MHLHLAHTPWVECLLSCGTGWPCHGCVCRAVSPIFVAPSIRIAASRLVGDEMCCTRSSAALASLLQGGRLLAPLKNGLIKLAVRLGFV